MKKMDVANGKKMSDEFAKFEETLDRCESWPCDYCFKFIVPVAGLPEMLELFAGFSVTTRESSKGSFVSITATATMRTAAEVVAVYRQAASIPGVIPL